MIQTIACLVRKERLVAEAYASTLGSMVAETNAKLFAKAVRGY
jgi:hypothetical protein